MALREYAAKRNFASTSEPKGRVGTRVGSALSFVVQKHDASRLHYDFRLEMEGVLKSWAVPKGFPTQTGEKRLAVQVEDHPLDYASFEGIIPEGNYGAGTVIVWDRGTYSVLDDEPLRGLNKGKLHVILEGEKLRGEWALVRMKPRPGEDKPQWLLFKAKSAVDPFTWDQEHRSVISGRTLEEVAKNKAAAVWRSNRESETRTRPSTRGAKETRERKRKPAAKPAILSTDEFSRLPKSIPRFLEPMKALSTDEVPRGPQWILEVKFDGIRALAIKNGSSSELISRAEKRLEGFAEIQHAIARLGPVQLTLDGELVAVDEEGRSSFQLLQSRNMGVEPPLFFYVFDILNLDGRDLRELPLTRRKDIAKAVLNGAPTPLRFSPALEADSEHVLRELQKRGLEGLIAKRRDSQYESGRRSGAWLKYKWTQQQEFVIGGYTPPQGGRNHFGALLVGYYAGDKLRFAGKVGTGFSEKLLRDLHGRFKDLVAADCPFSNLPEKRTSRFGGGMTTSEMRRCTWLKPELVCQVRFAQWTRDHHLRQPAFLGLREDKAPTDVVRESG